MGQDTAVPIPGLPVADESLVFVCRFCTRMAEQWDRGAKRCGLDCGGLKRGKTYPLYRGPLTRTWIASNCFVCGENADYRLRPQGEVQEVGVCKRHLIVAGIDPKRLEEPPKPEDLGVVEKKVKKVDLAVLLGLTPEAPEEGGSSGD